VTGHRLVNPPSLPRPSGYAHAVVAAPGRTVYLAGQAAHGPDGAITASTMAEQFEAAARNVMTALAAAGGMATHLVSMQIFVTSAAEYREALAEIGAAYRRHFGTHYPAMALVEVSALFDPNAQVELVCVAVIPEDGQRSG
jgi:enamine deaminase RidA (YjgF/YER057c/UK114 family)